MPKVQIFCCCLAVLLYPSLGAGLERDTSVVWDHTRFRDQIEDFVIADDNSLWVVQEQRITHFSTQQGYTNYYTRDGLPAAIKQLVKDNNGNIWCFGTQDKQLVISRFDGQSWQAGISLPERLRDNPDLFSTVLFDQKNDLWIGTGIEILGYYTGRSPPGAGLFFMGSSFSAHYTEENDLLQNAVFDLAATADGSIWVATSQGINRFKEQQWTSYTQHQGLFANATFKLVEMPHGELWAFHKPGISIFDPTSQTWQPASSHVMPANLGSFLLRTANNSIFFSYGGSGLVRYIQDNWIRVPSQSGFPDHVDILKQDASGAYWVLHNGILSRVIPEEPSSITIKGTITNKIDGTPWLHGAVRLASHEETLIAWTKTDDNGRYTMQVFAASTPTLDEANTYRLSVVNADGSIEVDLDHLGTNTIDLSVEKTEQPVDLRLFTVLLGCSFLMVIGFFRYKWTSNFLIHYSPIVFIGFVLVLVMFYCLYSGDFIVPYLINVTSLVWSIAFSLLIRFSNTNQILPLCLLRTNSRYGAYHYYKANIRSWAMVPIFPAIFGIVMITRHIKDPAQIGPYMAISVLAMLYCIIIYVVTVGYQSRSILRLQLENRWMENQFRFLFGLGMIVIVVLGANTYVLMLSFTLSSGGVITHLTNSLADFCLNMYFSAQYFLITVEYIVAGLIWIIVSIGAALVVFTPSKLTAKQRQVLFCRNLSFVLCISSYVISILLWVHTLSYMDDVGEVVKATALSIVFPCVALGLAGLIQWWSRQFSLPQAAPLEAAQYSSNKWLSGTLFILCLTGISFTAGSVRVEESVIISVIIFFFIVWMARRRTHLENLISQRTAELQQEKALVEAENIRKTGEFEEARNLQLSMLPQGNLVHPDIEIAFNMIPASEVGGDYFDYNLLANRTLTIAIGDATGHGLRAGIVVTATKSLFQVLSQETDLRHILSSISKTLKNMHLKRMNMALTLLKISNRKLTLSAAGMPPVLLYRAATKQVEEILLEGMPLGISSRSQYSEYKCDLQTGDTILLMSDGLPERLNPAGDLFDYSRVQQHFLDLADRPPEDICTQMRQAGEHWSAGHPQDDDVTLVAFKVK